MLWTFGIVRGNLVYFSRFCILYKEKTGNPAPNLCNSSMEKSRHDKILQVLQTPIKMSKFKSYY
jgi:hypothetical protein